MPVSNATDRSIIFFVITSPYNKKVVNCGNATTKNKTATIIIAKGKAPIKISPKVIDLSSRDDFITNTEIPNGGVNKPTSTAITVTIPNQIRSMFNDTKIGYINGTNISIIDPLSNIVPIKITKRMYKSIIDIILNSELTTKEPNSDGIPESANILAYIWAAIIKKEIAAVI